MIVDSLEAAKYIVAQWKKLQGTESDSRFQKYVKVQDLENSALELLSIPQRLLFLLRIKETEGKNEDREG